MFLIAEFISSRGTGVYEMRLQTIYLTLMEQEAKLSLG